MERTPLINYMMPQDMAQYMSYYGAHFNKNLYEFATRMMRKEDKVTGKPSKVAAPTMQELKTLLDKHKIEIDDNSIYDALYLAAMVKADFWGSAIEDDEHMARYIEDVICDIDGYEGIVFCRFLADCSAKGISIYWDLMI